MGAGESGVGAAVLAGAKGYDVFVSDSGTIAEKYKAMLLERDIPFEEGHHTEADILNADEIVKSPGIPDTAPIVRAAIERGIPILSEIELAGRYTDARMVCITGSNGKTTTTSLTYHILREAGMDVGLAGNIGRSLALQVAEDPHACYVIELSSFQLDNMYRFKADIAVLMNITPDHLNRYGGEMQRYVDAKLRILQNQTRADAFIYWADDPILRREVAKHHPEATCYPFSDADRPELKGRLTADGQICIETPRGTLRIPRTALALRGTHNLYNSIAAATAARLAGADDASIRRGLETFRGVEHRLEPVARVADVEYINDSKATNIDSCRYALQSVETPIVLILGGTDKGNDYGEIETMVRAKARGLVFLGVDNRKLHAAFDGKVPATCDARSMAEAIAHAARMARPGDTVLLSPCCASFDLFRNYEDRGEQFKQCVHALADGKEAGA
ncbi:UDP-N-acetylmuramoylalanine--D-glutamate ligase [Tannerella sp. oral taxon BU063 isolate Cell 6/7/9]|uniref:UDP-N-acetylmuramoylalanine--D-glutamate ligase n=1 Tax=Tannerella sp. oral taxon BU063 isolate Cell 6/7/9 TaxID=1411021 RepID=W2CQU5_9BACT|nr:UDP-N-acetylmuramoylalanine--D-glutamate ligase [Tannerella sp. oral taxon BU063 isolate Cell 6/7/9]